MDITISNIETKDIVAELAKLGWIAAPEDVSHALIALYTVRTFRGEESARMKPLTRFEDGTIGLSAEFISKGENALALCPAYIAISDEIAIKVAEFHAEVMKYLSLAYSVRIRQEVAHG